LQNDAPDNTDLWPPIDESQDRELRVQTGPLREQTSPEQEPVDPDAAGEMPDTIIPSTPEPWATDNLKASHIVGTGDCYLGEIVYSYDAAIDKTKAQFGTIDVRRVQPWYDGAGVGDLTLGEIPPPLSAPNPSLTQATPFPTVDQRKYYAEEGDPVLVVTGRDGRAYYLPDNAPFIGVVASVGSTKEANFGGAGNTTIKVTRQLLSGNPTAGAPTFAAITAVTYDYVFPLTIIGQHHGYRTGDKVLCFRRGMYVFCLPARGMYHGKIVATGPNSEADFTDYRYWVQLGTSNIIYETDGDPPAGTNIWDWNKADTALFKVCAANLAEVVTGGHHLLDQCTATSEYPEVAVFLFADTDAALKYPYWVFTSGPDLKVKVTLDDDYPGTLNSSGAGVGNTSKIIGDADSSHWEAASGEHIQCIVASDEEENGETRQQLVITHVGPGEIDPSHTWQVTIGERTLTVQCDAKGHVVNVYG